MIAVIILHNVLCCKWLIDKRVLITEMYTYRHRCVRWGGGNYYTQYSKCHAINNPFATADKIYHRSYADSEAPDQPARYAQSGLRATLSTDMSIAPYLTYTMAVVWNFTVRIWHFIWRRKG